MRRDGLNDFYEVNFLRLREIDATYPSEPIRYADWLTYTASSALKMQDVKKYRLMKLPLKKEKHR